MTIAEKQEVDHPSHHGTLAGDPGENRRVEN
jgi:hypothetical protein